MSRIYNEIIIDMNPESRSFEKVIYEDSFEYSGDIMLAQDPPTDDAAGADTADAGEGTVAIGGVQSRVYEYYTYNKESASFEGPNRATQKPSWSEAENMYKKSASGEYQKGTYAEIKRYKEYKYDDQAKKYVYTGQSIDENPDKPITKFANETEAEAKRITGKESDWGAANITKDMFVNPDGSPKDIEEIYNTLDPLFPSKTGETLKLEIRDMLPKYTGVSKEERGFLEKERGFAEREAKMGKERDLYGLQKGAGKLGAQMRGAYGGMGGGMRGAMAGQAGIKKGAEAAYDIYGLERERAAFAEEKGIYGLEKAAGAEFEAGLSKWVRPEWMTTGTAGVQTTAFNAREGGRVPKKGETFLNMLSQLPDAGGS